MSLSDLTERQGAQAHRTSAHRASARRPSAQRPSARAEAFAPWLEQSILFGMFSAAAGFWMAVIWWIVR